MTKTEMKKLVVAAQAMLKDERHWTTTDVADRAESGEDLAKMVLTALGVEEDECPAECDECKETAENTGTVT